jgi:hypothetical protein
MATEKTKKNEHKYICKMCYFNTCKKTDYDRHLSSQKHSRNTLTTIGNGIITTKICLSKHICDYCKKEYNDRSGLWRHKKKCQTIFLENKKDESTDKELIMMLVKQNTELLELVKNGTHNTIINNTHNKTFNLQFFLNETCKDAMNIMDFVDTIKVQLTDLIKVGEIGYVEGISNIITNNLKALDISQRPIHCTDKKREVLYIKDEDKWEKEDEEKKKLRKAIKIVAYKNINALPQFKEKYPDCKESDSKFSDQYNHLIIEAMGGPGDNDIEKEDNIIKNISKLVIIDKD